MVQFCTVLARESVERLESLGSVLSAFSHSQPSCAREHSLGRDHLGEDELLERERGREGGRERERQGETERGRGKQSEIDKRGRKIGSGHTWKARETEGKTEIKRG